MAQKKTNPMIKVIAIPIIVVILGVALVAIFAGGSSKPKNNLQVTQKQDSDAATGDTPVETLKTLTAEMTKVEEQNKKLIGANSVLKQKDQQSLSQWKNDLLVKVKEEIASGTNISSAQTKSQLQREIDKIEGKAGGFPVDGGQMHQFVWVHDLSVTTTIGKNGKTLTSGMASLLNPGVAAGDDSAQTKKKSKPIPYYTIPENTILTGAVALQPLIGRTPQDGKVTDPYTFSVVFGPKSIAANNAEIPQAIHGIIASGVATGDAMGSCVRGHITSMTFIFPDGRINTVDAKDSNSLGTIAAANGNPCIPGIFHTNAAKVFLGTGLFAGLQGYGAGISQAETSSVTSLDSKTNISTVIGNANKYAIGSGVSTMGQEMRQWWNDRMKNYFDFVYVPNHTKHGLLELNIKVTKQLDIDYNKSRRKIYYEHTKNSFAHSLLD